MTAIELLIDRACGYAPRDEDFIRLKCPICGTSIRCLRHEIDPPSATLVEFPCLACSGEKAVTPIYKDEEGKVVPL